MINAATTVGFTLLSALPKSNVAPIAISPIGVAIPPTLDTALFRIVGIGRCSADHARPVTMPSMIGFVTIPFNVRFHIARSNPCCPGLKSDSTRTAITLYNGTLPMIISGAIPAVP